MKKTQTNVKYFLEYSINFCLLEVSDGQSKHLFLNVAISNNRMARINMGTFQLLDDFKQLKKQISKLSP